MNLKKQTLLIALALVAFLTSTSFTVAGQDTRDKQSSESFQASEKSLVGVWRTVVTPRNCQTGDQVVPSFPGLFTFHQGGTMSEYGISPGLTPALRSPGHGLWKRERGWQDYSFTFLIYRYNASGVFIGSQKVTSVLQLGETGDGFTSSSSVQVFDANDNQIGGFCATAVGTRFE